jgi:SepF-like predicted cell division protein (DUF552 family)
LPTMGLFRKPKKEEDEKKAESPTKDKEESGKTTYLKAMPLRDLSDIEDVKSAVDELYEFAESIGGDIARLGEERIVICPPNIRIWRENRQVSKQPLPTAA